MGSSEPPRTSPAYGPDYVIVISPFNLQYMWQRMKPQYVISTFVDSTKVCDPH